jgi:hypothetical protein
MSNKTIETVLEEQTKAKAQKREFRMLATLLAHQFHVSVGNHLVPMIGSGTEQNNIEAIAYWLAQHGHYIEEAKTTKLDPLNQLHNELNKQLLRLEIGG